MGHRPYHESYSLVDFSIKTPKNHQNDKKNALIIGHFPLTSGQTFFKSKKDETVEVGNSRKCDFLINICVAFCLKKG